MATLSGFYGVLAAILAMIGIYGIISYMVVRRRNEIGVRIALGAGKVIIINLSGRGDKDVQEVARLTGKKI